MTTAEELTGLFPSAKIAYLLEEAQASYTIPAVQQDTKFPKIRVFLSIAIVQVLLKCFLPH